MQSFFFLGLIEALGVPPPPPLLLVLPKVEVASDSDSWATAHIWPWDLLWSRPELVQDGIAQLIVDATCVKNILHHALTHQCS